MMMMIMSGREVKQAGRAIHMHRLTVICDEMTVVIMVVVVSVIIEIAIQLLLIGMTHLPKKY